MGAFYDAVCPCGKRIGWHGEVSDRPACPKCGARPSDTDLAETQAAIDDFRELLRTKPEGNTAKRQRLAAGLGLGQAAKLLGLPWQDLKEIEHGKAPMPDGLPEKMVEVYGLTGLDVPPCKG